MPPNPINEILANTAQIIANTESIIATQAIHTQKLDQLIGLVVSSGEFSEVDRETLLEVLEELRNRVDPNYDEAFPT